MLHVFICDDNPLHAQSVEQKTACVLANERHKIHTYTDPVLLLQSLLHTQQSALIVLLDIDLETQLNGIALANQIHQIRADAQIIFVTGYIHYATEVGEAEPVYFVTKPVSDEKLRRALQKAKAKLAHDRISFQLRGETLITLQQDIRYIERIKRTSCIHSAEEVLSVSDNLDEILSRLDGRCFVRCHNSYIVNLAWVATFSSTQLTLKSGGLVPISRKFRPLVLEQYADYMGGLL